MKNIVSLQEKELGKELGFIHEGLITLRNAGMTPVLWAQLTENKELAKKVVTCIKRGGYEPTTSQKQAREIMGKNFLGVEEVTEHFGIVLTKKERTKIAEIPFSEAMLQECKDTHILFLGVNHDKEGKPLTINRFKEMFPTDSQPKFYSYQESWYDDRKKFATKETPELRWYLIKKAILEESRSKTYNQQEKLLKENEYRERAVVYIYGILLMFEVTGERLLEDDYVRCKDLGSDRKHTDIGGFDSWGLYVDRWLDNDCSYYLGLVPARKFD